MSGTQPEALTLLQALSDSQLAESLASWSGRDANFPPMKAAQEKAYLDLLRDRLKILQKTEQVGLLDHYINSVSYPPLPITGIKVCLYILKSTGWSDSTLQVKLAATFEDWRVELKPLAGPQIAGLQSIWSSEVLCQLLARTESPSSTSKRKRTLDNAHDDEFCFPLMQRPRTSSSKTQHEITHHLSPKNQTTSQPPNATASSAGPLTLQESKASTESFLPSRQSDHQDISQEFESMPSSSPNNIVISKPIDKKVQTPMSGDSPALHVSQPAISQKEIVVSPSTLNLLNYWEHTFRMLDSAVTELLEITPLSPHVPLTQRSSYYPRAYSPNFFHWIPMAHLAFAPTLKFPNDAVVTPQAHTPDSSTTQRITIPTGSSSHQSNSALSDLNPDGKLSNASTTFSQHANLPTPVSPKQHSLQPVVSTSGVGQTSTYSAPIQSSGGQHEQRNQHPENHNLRQSYQQPGTALKPKQIPQHPRDALNPTQSIQHLEKALLNCAEPNQKVRNFFAWPPELSLEPHMNIPSTQPSQQPEFSASSPAHSRSQKFGVTPMQPSQQLDFSLPSSQQLIQKPVLNPTPSLFPITEVQKKKIVDTYRRVGKTGQAELEATLRKNRLWEHLSPLLLTPIIDDTHTNDCHGVSQSNSNIPPINSTLNQPSLSPSQSMAPLVQSKPIATAEQSRQSITPPQVTSNSMRPERKTSSDSTSLNSIPVKPVVLTDQTKPSASPLDFSVTTPQTASETNDHEADDSANTLVANADPPNSTKENEIYEDSTTDTRESIRSITNSIDRSGEMNVTKREGEMQSEDELDTEDEIEIINTHKGGETNIKYEDEIEIFTLDEYNKSKSITPSRAKSPTQNKILTKKIKIVKPIPSKKRTSERPITQKGTWSPISPIQFNVFQDDLPGIPDVDPSVQIQGTRARILARFPPNQQMPPVRTFIPLSTNVKPR